jgi:hypothetical protein
MANGCVSGSTEFDLLAPRELAGTGPAAVNFVYVNIIQRSAAVCTSCLLQSTEQRNAMTPKL